MSSLHSSPPLSLSDSLVGHVLPRANPHGSAGHLSTIKPDPNPACTPRVTPLTLQREHQARNTMLLPPSHAESHVPPRPGQTSIPVSPQPKTTRRRTTSKYSTTEIRRAQCRVNQARYRYRQRLSQLKLEKEVRHLYQEINSLKRRHQYEGRSSLSPWSTVAELFHLLESSFRSPWIMTSTDEMANHTNTRQLLAVLEGSFAHNASMGGLSGKALVEQLRIYSQCFGDPQLQLKRIESVATGVMTAKAKLSVTVTELTLRNVFPKFHEHSKIACDSVQFYQRLLGQRLQLNFSMNFLFDEHSDRVERLEIKIDLITPFLRVLGNLEDVADVLEHAQISSECVMGNIKVDGSSANDCSDRRNIVP
ncbi:unnamed protein product [Phytophthora lilii]|uniref:Unnamed protein product n=1 Tax=Phytophthora lilii TaxID=2077276 RepID=A0A9W6U2Q3_9STRA|nr:unnamed protein product [Phytophthora lilii]